MTFLQKLVDFVRPIFRIAKVVIHSREHWKIGQSAQKQLPFYPMVFGNVVTICIRGPRDGHPSEKECAPLINREGYARFFRMFSLAKFFVN